MSICFLKDFSCEIKKPLSIKERSKTGSFRFLTLFFKKYEKIDERQRADKISNKAKPCPMLMSTLKNKEEKLFHRH